MERYILTVSLNAAVDVAYTIDDFAAGKINMVKRILRVAGGKANNCARVLAGALDQQVMATGFAGGSAGRFIQEDLRARGIQADFQEIQGENRTCFAIMDPVTQTVSEIREAGPTLAPDDPERFLSRYRRLLARAALVVVSGSLPPGVPKDFYATLTEVARKTYQIPTIVDASGAALKNALPARPLMVKPNEDELAEWAGRPLEREADFIAAARALRAEGPEIVIVSTGEQGALAVTAEGVWKAVPPRIAEVRNTVGSGDSLVAGFAAGMARRLKAEDAFVLGVACGTANVLTHGVAEVHADDLAKIRPQISPERLS